jgi:hypothetical protein
VAEEKDPALALVGRVEAAITKGRASGTFRLDLPAEDHGDWEYVIVARVPSRGLSKQGEKPLLVEDPLPAVRWAKTKVRIGEEAELLADLAGGEAPPDAASLDWVIWKRDRKDVDDVKVATVKGEQKGNQLVAKWKVDYKDDTYKVDSHVEMAEIHERSETFNVPTYYFQIQKNGKVLKESPRDEPGLLHPVDVIDRPVHDAVTGLPIPGAQYEVTFADGTSRKGRLTAESRIHEEDVPPCAFWVRVLAGEVKRCDVRPGALPGIADDREGGLRVGRPSAPPPPPPAVLARPVVIRRIAAAPPMVEPGAEVEILAEIANAKDGEPVKLLVFRHGVAEPVAALDAHVAQGNASVRWKVAGAQGGGRIGRYAFADFDVAVECRGVSQRSERAAFRGLSLEG